MKDKKLQQTVLKVKDLKLEDLIDSIKAHEASEEQINTTHTYDETRTVNIIRGRDSVTSKQHREATRKQAEGQEDPQRQGGSS